VLCHTRSCGLPKTFVEPNRDREGAEMQGVAAVGGGRFLTGAVRISRRNTCYVTLADAPVGQPHEG